MLSIDDFTIVGSVWRLLAVYLGNSWGITEYHDRYICTIKDSLKWCNQILLGVEMDDEIFNIKKEVNFT